jgi:hypothetical protein
VREAQIHFRLQVFQLLGERIVEVFDLEGNAKSTRVNAWSSPIEGSEKRRYYAVLHLGGIRSPADAVRAAIVAGIGTPKVNVPSGKLRTS